MRGEDIHVEEGNKVAKGNTPTCVGKTKTLKQDILPNWKHPHVRGEDLSAAFDMSLPMETPPRAWGRRLPAQGIARRLGNTPTCVGKTSPSFMMYLDRWKHPHVRGEDAPKRRQSAYDKETPPRAWGRPWALSLVFSRMRNTPTCVGKTKKKFQKSCDT